MGGGGGGSATQTSGLPDWAQPYVEKSLGSAVNLYDQGGLEHVEGLNQEQQDALGAQKELGSRGGVYDSIASDSYGATQAYRDAASGQGLFGADALGQQTTALADSIGKAQAGVLGQNQGQQALGGQLGSARAQAANQASQLKVGGDMASKELANRRSASLQGAGGQLGAGSELQNQFGAGASTLGDVGSTIQQQQQAEGDAAYQGIQRLFGLYSSPAVGSTSTTKQSGGK